MSNALRTIRRHMKDAPAFNPITKDSPRAIRPGFRNFVARILRQRAAAKEQAAAKATEKAA